MQFDISDTYCLVVSKLNINEVVVVDGIYLQVLHELRLILFVTLTLLFGRSLQYMRFPEDWRSVAVALVFKKGNMSKINYCRSLNLVCCKLIESVIGDNVMIYF